ncbi:MAG TPA: hypothetical protein VHU23_16450 [Rhizomicrobium sp.]|nr:hypothetical protein [Rhizomicrobium sp.]
MSDDFGAFPAVKPKCRRVDFIILILAIRATAKDRMALRRMNVKRLNVLEIRRTFLDHSLKILIERCQTLGLLGKQSLGLFLFGNVTRNFCGPYDLAVLIFDWRNRQRNIYQLAVFGLTYRFEMFHPLAASDLAEDVLLFMVPLARNKRQDRLAYNLVGSVTEKTFRSFVPALDNAVRILADNGVFRRFDQRREMACTAFTDRVFCHH